jgi:uncharacterized DUF497 family protein
MSLQFEWDPKKAKANLASHGIAFEEALTVFADPLARIFEDEEHSDDEPREIIIGHSIKRRLVLVCFAARGTKIRVISARKATRLERKDYEENINS